MESGSARDYADVLGALDDLDRVDRAVLRLIYWHGLTQTQAAGQLELPESTVKRCAARGLQQLARRISNADTLGRRA